MGASSIIQIKTCEIVNQSKIALKRYFYENKPKTAALNETRISLDINQLEKKNSRKLLGHDIGVAKFVEKLVLHARITELPIKQFDFMWITVLLDNTKLIVFTVYIRPQIKDHMHTWIEQMKNAFDYVKRTSLKALSSYGIPTIDIGSGKTRSTKFTRANCI